MAHHFVWNPAGTTSLCQQCGSVGGGPGIVAPCPYPAAASGAPAVEQVTTVLTRIATMLDIVSDMAFEARSETHRSRASQLQFKNALIVRYDAEEQGQLRCQVTGRLLSPNICVAAHLIPHSNPVASVLILQHRFDINDPSNGILWATGIEEVSQPPGRFCITYDPFQSRLVFRVLDPSLMGTRIKGINRPPIYFRDVNGRPLVPDDVSRMPKLRILYKHAVYCVKVARREHWITGNEGWVESLDLMKDAINALGEDDSSADVYRSALPNPHVPGGQPQGRSRGGRRGGRSGRSGRSGQQ